MSATAAMRSRTKVKDETGAFRQNKITWSLDSSAPSYRDWGTKTVTTVSSAGVAGKVETCNMVDWIVEHYKSRIQAGEVIASPCSKSIRIINDNIIQRNAGYYKMVPVMSTYPPNPNVPYYKKGLGYDGTVPSSSFLGSPGSDSNWTLQLPDVSSSQSLIDEQVTSAYAKVDTSEVSALVTIGEAKETIEYLYHSGLKLLKIYKAIRKLNFKALYENLSVLDFCKRYLEYRYALRPLVSEMDQYFQAVFVGKSWPQRKTFRSMYQDSGINQSPDYIAYSSPTFGTATAREYAEISVQIRAGVLCAIELDKLDRWGMKTLAESALDLIPLSFIADWFFNISQTLAAHVPSAGTKQLASWYSLTRSVKRTKRLVSSNCPSSVTVSSVTYDHVYSDFSNCYIEREDISYTRVINPELRLFPQFTVKLNGWKLLDLGSLLTQAISIPPNQTYVKRRKLATMNIDGHTLVW